MANTKLIDKVLVAARVSSEFNDLLNSYAKLFGCKKSELIKEALSRYLNQLKEIHGVPSGYYTEEENGKKVD